ncbi:MAG: type II secretion system F family protein [Burkholderiales bacterium]
MPYFSYKGRNARGELVQGGIESADTAAVADHLFNTGITPIDILPADEPAQQSVEQWLSRFTSKVGLVDLILFSRQMHTLLKAGVPILRALAGLQESTRNQALGVMLQDIRGSLDSGRELSAALRRHPKVFSPFYFSMVRVGEFTGTLDQVFLRLYHYLEFEREIRDRIKSALRYPIFVVVAIAVALVVVNLFVIPAFAKVFAGYGAELPLMTRVLISFSNFMVATWPWQLLLLVLAVAGFRWYVTTRNGKYRWDKFKLYIPIAGKIVLRATLARFARSFALAFGSGVPAVQVLNVVAQVVDNDYIAQRVEQMRDGVERGESVFRTAITTGVFTPTVLQMIAVGEESGELDDMMQEVAEMYEREVEYEVKTLAQQIEPILIVALGVMVLVLALGIFLPVWNLAKVMIK